MPTMATGSRIPEKGKKTNGNPNGNIVPTLDLRRPPARICDGAHRASSVLTQLGLLELQLGLLDFHLLHLALVLHLPQSQLAVRLELLFTHLPERGDGHDQH